MRATYIRPNELKQIDQIIFKFIWNIKPSSTKTSGKIKRQILQSQKEFGGLNAPDTNNLDRALKYKHILQSLHKQHPIKSIVKKLCTMDDNLLNIHAKSDLKNTYMGRVMECNKLLIQRITSDLLSLTQDQTTQINRCYFDFIDNYPFKGSHLLNKNQSNLVRKLNNVNIYTYGDLLRESINRTKPASWFEVMQISNSFPQIWKTYWKSKTTLTGRESVMYPTNQNIWKTHTNITTKSIRDMLFTQCYNSTDDILRHIERKHNITIQNEEQNPFLYIKNITKEESLKNVQYKMLHNIYPTAVHLHKWKLSNSPNCSSCNSPETLIHAIFTCDIAKQTIINFKNVIYVHCGIRLDIGESDMLTGIRTSSTINNALNCILIIIKRRLVLQRQDKSILSETEIEKLIKMQINKEKYIAVKNNQIISHQKRWGTMINI